METNEKIIIKFDSLIDEGLKAIKNDDCEFSSHEDTDIVYRRVRTEGSNLVKRICGPDSHHYFELKKMAEEPKISTNSYYLKDVVGVLQAARNDFNGGYLFDLKSLVLAEVLGDFLEQCEVLINSGYVSASASVCGAVLEDTLRKVCDKNNIAYPEKTTIGKLNAELARASVYSKLTQKQITANADIRNNADHGHHDKFTKNDVEDMIKFVGRFSAEHLG